MANVKGKDNYEVMPQIQGVDIVPSGGSAADVLTKDTGTDYDYSWQPAATPATKAILLRHNGATTQTLTTTFVTQLFGTSIRSDSIYSYAAGIVTINRTGWFKVTAEVTSTSDGARSGTELRLSQNGATGIVGSLSAAYHRNRTQGLGTASSTWLINNTSGGTIRAQIREYSGGCTTVANACRLLIEEVDGPS